MWEIEGCFDVGNMRDALMWENMRDALMWGNMRDALMWGYIGGML